MSASPLRAGVSAPGPAPVKQLPRLIKGKCLTSPEAVRSYGTSGVARLTRLTSGVYRRFHRDLPRGSHRMYEHELRRVSTAVVP